MRSREVRRSPSKVKLLISLVSLVTSVTAVSIGSYEYLKNSESFASEMDSIKEVAKVENKLPANFHTFPAFIKSMPIEPRDADDDSNGLRDDLQVYIAYKYPHDAVARSALIQLASVTDNMTTVQAFTRIDKVAILLHEEETALRCFYDRNFSKTDLEKLHKKVFNSSRKRENYELAKKRRIEIPEFINFKSPKDPCDLLLLNNEQSLQQWTP